MARKAWSAAEVLLLHEAVNNNIEPYQYNRRASNKTDWFMVAIRVNRDHGNSRTALDCKEMYKKHNKRKSK